MIPPAQAAEAPAARAAGSAGSAGGRLRAMIATSRPRQWPKNLLVVAAPLAGGVVGQPAVLARTVVAGAAFLLASAAVYAVNDVADAERDRAHPVKRSRPVAAGELPARHALALAVGCTVLALAAGLAIGAPLLSAAVAGYLAISFLYSLGLKHVPGVEAVLVASGFLLRVLGGAAAARVAPSGWFLLVCSSGALGVALAKRYTERVTLGAEAMRHRPVLRSYSAPVLRLSQLAAAALMTACYLLWAAGEDGRVRPWHLISAIPLAAALGRFAVLTGRRTVRPVEDMIARDGTMLACEAAWLALFILGLGLG
jgi:decaprenyl-phosphate phosphoribosyltransferase